MMGRSHPVDRDKAIARVGSHYVAREATRHNVSVNQVGNSCSGSRDRSQQPPFAESRQGHAGNAGHNGELAAAVDLGASSSVAVPSARRWRCHSRAAIKLLMSSTYSWCVFALMRGSYYKPY